MIDKEYFRDYRIKLGFTNQNGVKSFLAAKDIKPTVDYQYIELLNSRLIEILQKVNQLIPNNLGKNDFKLFCSKNIEEVFNKLKKHKIISKLNNQGRRCEQVYFSWMRGYIISTYFLTAISDVFNVDIKKIKLIGDDDLINIDTFKRTPKADLEITLKNNGKIRLEIQSGYVGINDIKQHKVLEAQRIYREDGTPSIAIHFDLFNGQVAFLNLHKIKDNNVNWITRQQMEGQTVFNIDQNSFVWKLTEEPPNFKDLDLE